MFWNFHFSTVNWIKFVSFWEHFPKNFRTKGLEKNLSEIRWPGCMFFPLFFLPFFLFALFCASHALNQSQVYFFLCKFKVYFAHLFLHWISTSNNNPRGNFNWDITDTNWFSSPFFSCSEISKFFLKTFICFAHFLKIFHVWKFQLYCYIPSPCNCTTIFSWFSFFPFPYHVTSNIRIICHFVYIYVTFIWQAFF